jgi:hypothetical protein
MHHSEENRDDPKLQECFIGNWRRVRRKWQKTIQQGSSSHRYRIESLALEPDPKSYKLSAMISHDELDNPYQHASYLVS